jgi:hypothetical protein
MGKLDIPMASRPYFITSDPLCLHHIEFALMLYPEALKANLLGQKKKFSSNQKKNQLHRTVLKG